MNIYLRTDYKKTKKQKKKKQKKKKTMQYQEHGFWSEELREMVETVKGKEMLVR